LHGERNHVLTAGDGSGYMRKNDLSLNDHGFVQFQNAFSS